MNTIFLPKEEIPLWDTLPLFGRLISVDPFFSVGHFFFILHHFLNPSFHDPAHSFLWEKHSQKK